MNYDIINPDLYSFLLGLPGFQEAYAVADWIGDAQRVLLVGQSSGRDYYYLKALGKDVYAVDIVRNLKDQQIIQANAEHPLPFQSASFDAVVMCEVLEHLYNDTGALKEARRVLKDDGVLFATVPFWSDTPFHARLHSPRTFNMLVEYEGFKVEWFYERGQLFRFTRLIVLVCALTYHLKRLTGSEESRVEHYFKILRPITRFNLSRRLPRLWWPRHRLGGYIAARKGEFLSFVAIQEAYFKRGGIARPTNE